MTKVVVIGSNGQLGRDCLSVFPKSFGVDFPEIDIADRFQCLEKLDGIQPNVIVNCAAYTAVDACESDLDCWKVNANGPKHLAEWAEANDAFLVHVSTDYVFAGDKPLFEAYVEADETGPVSEYGRSKLAGERAVMEIGARAAILRTAWLYGVHGKNFLKTMLRLALQGPEREIRVINDQFGSPTWSHTLARQLETVVETQAVGLFHATSEGCCCWYDLAESFLSKMAVPYRMVPCTSAEYLTPARRPKNSILENANAKELGLNVFKDWNEELAVFVERHGAALLSEAEGLLK